MSRIVSAALTAPTAHYPAMDEEDRAVESEATKTYIIRALASFAFVVALCVVRIYISSKCKNTSIAEERRREVDMAWISRDDRRELLDGRHLLSQETHRDKKLYHDLFLGRG